MQTKQYHFQKFSFSLGFFSSNLSKETLGQELLIKGASKKTIIDRNFFSSLLESEHFFKLCISKNMHVQYTYNQAFLKDLPCILSTYSATYADIVRCDGILH